MMMMLIAILLLFSSRDNIFLKVQGLSIKSKLKQPIKKQIIPPVLQHHDTAATNYNRRSFLHSPIALVVSNHLVNTASTIQPAIAKTAEQKNNAMEDINTIIDAADTLDKLLSNWDKATIDCTYADVPRELLEQKNKEQLLEKASTFALFDKSTSVVSCKKTNKIVRDYIGVTGKGPLVNVDKKMIKRYVVDKLDPDVLDQYYTEVENFQNAISRASSLSYAAGIADFDSVNNFEKDSKLSEENSNLEQARKAIGEAKTSIDQIVLYLTTSES